jgi:hypothetical protein
MTAPSEPEYPLSREEFRRALATGHGRAKIHVERFGAAEFREEILEAATVNLVWDQQVNGPRGDWLAEMCIAAGLAETVVAQAIPDDHNDRAQRIALLLEFARRGIAGARPALYACLGRAKYSSDVYASREIIELDGEAGLLFVARAMGRMLADDSDFSAWGYELSVFDEQHGEGAGRALLELAAATDASVRLYLEYVQRHEAVLAEERSARSRDDARPGRPTRATISVEEALRRILASEPGEPEGGLGYWGRRAEAAELAQVLDLLITSSNPRVLESALRALGGPDHPPLHSRILELTRHADDDVRFWAGRVLSKHSRADIRELGLEALARGDAQVGLEILRGSAQAEDAAALLGALVSLRSADPGRLHAAESTALEMLEEHPDLSGAAIALEIYAQSACAHCRGRAFEHLLELRACPQWVIDECAKDGFEWIREVAVRGLPQAGDSR